MQDERRVGLKADVNMMMKQNWEEKMVSRCPHTSHEKVQEEVPPSAGRSKKEGYGSNHKTDAIDGRRKGQHDRRYHDSSKERSSSRQHSRK